MAMRKTCRASHLSGIVEIYLLDYYFFLDVYVFSFKESYSHGVKGLV